MGRSVLARASEPLPTVLATLDALARAARAHGFPVIGI